LRPDVGVEAQFSNKKSPKTYRYDSSLAPELSWDESADRAFAEWLLTLVADASEKGEAKVFATPQVWQGNEESFSSLSQCVARLRSLTKPFLNWTGKAERRQVTVPTLPLFVHERHSTQAILETLKSHRLQPSPLAQPHWVKCGPETSRPLSLPGLAASSYFRINLVFRLILQSCASS